MYLNYNLKIYSSRKDGVVDIRCVVSSPLSRNSNRGRNPIKFFPTSETTYTHICLPSSVFSVSFSQVTREIATHAKKKKKEKVRKEKLSFEDFVQFPTVATLFHRCYARGFRFKVASSR